jgi:phage gp36-like protein
MAYAAASDLVGLIPTEWRDAATDDNGDATAESISAVLTSAEDEINGTLSTRYTVPIDLTADAAPVELLRHACRYLAAELCYGRRSMQEQFPFKTVVEQIRTTLRQIAQGKIPLFPNSEQVADELVVVSQPSRVNSSHIAF